MGVQIAELVVKGVKQKCDFEAKGWNVDSTSPPAYKVSAEQFILVTEAPLTGLEDWTQLMFPVANAPSHPALLTNIQNSCLEN